MRTKLTLALTAGLMSIALTGVAQGVDSNLSSGTMFDSSLVAPGWSIMDDSTAQALNAATVTSAPGKRSLKSSTDNNSVDWLDLNANGQGGLSSVTFGVPAPASASASFNVGSEYAINPAMDNGVLRQEDRVGSNLNSGHMPLLSSPEPGTISLLAMGAAALAGTLRRRK